MIQLSDKQSDLNDILPTAIFSTDSIGHITYYNEKAAEMWGRHPRLNDPTELAYCGAIQLFDADGHIVPRKEYATARALREGKRLKKEPICIDRPDGSRLPAVIDVDLIAGTKGAPIGTMNVLHHAPGSEVPATAQWLAAIVESSEDAIISETLDGIITSWNKGASKIFGYSREEILGRPISTIIPQALRQEEIHLLRKVSRGEKIESYETTRVTKSGKHIDISLTLSPVKDKNGLIIGASKISRDITEQVCLKQKLEEYAQMLAEMLKHKDEFIALASHELKTPATTIKGYLQIIEEEIAQADHKMYLQKTLRQVDKLTGLISDMLDVTKMQNGKLKMNFSKFDISQLLADCTEGIREREIKHTIKINNSFAEPVLIMADKKRIGQVLDVLLTNAIKYSPHADNIVINSRVDSNAIVVSVQDFGPGIPTDKLEKIFTRFYRIDRTDFSSGLGIGLYIAKEIITEHSGEIWVESEEGKGATFFVTIPLSH